MIKKLFIFVLIAAILLAGCDTAPVPTEPTTTSSTQTTTSNTPTATAPSTDATVPTEPEPSIRVQYLPETVENPDELPVLKWICLTDHRFGEENHQIRSEDAVHELNNMLADRNMPFRVQFVLLLLDAALIQWNWFETPEATELLQDADLIWGIMNADEMKEYLYPITDYVSKNNDFSLINAVPHEKDWLLTTVEKEIYGIPTTPSLAYSNGWRVDPSLLQQTGLTTDDFSRNFWEMDNVFAAIYEKNGKQPFLTKEGNGVTNTFSGVIESTVPSSIYDKISQSFQLIGSFFAIDHTDGELKVVNILETEIVRNIQQAIVRYRNAGYIAETSSSAKLTYMHVLGDRVYINASGDYCIPVTEPMFARSIANTVSGIAAVSDNKSEAAMLLNLIAEDEDFRMQLLFGKEGRDYSIDEGNYTLTTREDGSRYSMSMLSPFSYFSNLTTNRFCRLSLGTYNGYLSAYEGETKLQTYQEILNRVDRLCIPIAFDYSALEQDVAAVKEIFMEYSDSFGNKMTSEDYEQMIRKMKDAGSDKIITELQRQLDMWLKDHPAS